MTKTSEIKAIMRDYFDKKEDENHWIRRFFRCYIDGSYNGVEHYKSNCSQIRYAYNNDKDLRSFVICQFTRFIGQEHDCCYSTAQNAIVSECTKNELDRLNTELIDDARDLVRESMTV